ncbi:hypothetical protein M422DRAFT_259764 [Sphaerobolus stellatus SS14]|uniref:Uncharacterized protein n=1 Tax=Sphaerobolus stellatus (strain SS14) TaxID=990650 RepID=A0A0C9U401_SPHS4|nr:hypothetical protein M422DRAFT_259764 [Sphaerobolus stellatus SS14]
MISYDSTYLRTSREAIHPRSRSDRQEHGIVEIMLEAAWMGGSVDGMNRVRCVAFDGSCARRCGGWLCPSGVITAALCHIPSAVPSASGHPSEEDGRVWLCVRYDATAHRLSTLFLRRRHLANLALRSLHFESIDSFILSLSCDLPINHTDAFIENTSIIQYWILDSWNLGGPLGFRGMEAKNHVHYIEDKLHYGWKCSD